MNSLTDEIAELCRLILSLEKRVAPLREKMFNYPCMTDEYLWAYIIGADA